MNKLDKVSRTLCLIASCLLLLIGVFHGSGFNYVNNLVRSSDVADLIKTIFPVLFILPSIQLTGLAIFGFLAIGMKEQAYKILLTLSILTLIDALLAFYLSAFLPGMILALPCLLFGYAAYRNRTVILDTF